MKIIQCYYTLKYLMEIDPEIEFSGADLEMTLTRACLEFESFSGVVRL